MQPGRRVAIATLTTVTDYVHRGDVAPRPKVHELSLSEDDWGTLKTSHLPKVLQEGYAIGLA